MVHSCTDPRFKPRYQWEPSSGTFDCSQSNNCGPTGSSQQADYYKGSVGSPVLFHIENTRTLAADRCRPTNAWEQAEMFTRRTGVPCHVVFITDVNDLDRLLSNTRPIGIGVQMSRMTAATRGHPFLGWHRITLLRKDTRRRYVNGVLRRLRGYVYTDPNFHPKGTGYREDPKNGRRWISRRELDYAYVQNYPAYAIVPDRKKS